MKHLPISLRLALVACPLACLAENIGVVREIGMAPAVVVPLTDLSRNLASNPAVFSVDLRTRFTIPGVNAGQLVQFKTTQGTFNTELLVADAPLTVANFKSYLANDSTPAASLAATYDNTFFHRSVSNFVIQGGGFRLTGDLTTLAAKPPVLNEFKVANTRGTIAMAKVGPAAGQEPTPTTINSATNQWFINLADNIEVLDNQNGGFTAFARVIGNGMTAVDAIAALPKFNLTESVHFAEFFSTHPGGTAFKEVPLKNYSGGSNLLLTSFATIQSARLIPLQPPATGAGVSVLTYTVTNDNPNVADVVLANGNLKVTPKKLAGRALVTVRAAEAGGAFAESTFTLERAGPPAIFAKLPATTTAPLGVNLTIPASVAGLPTPTVKWQRRPAGGDWADIPVDNTTDLFTLNATSGLAIRLNGSSAEDTAAALDLDRSQLRYIVTQANESGPLTITSAVTTLRVTKTLAFTAKLAATTTASLGSTVTLSGATTSATFPAVTFKWQSKAPGATNWVDLVSSTTAAPTPYTGVTTATLRIALTGTGPAALVARDLDRTQYRCVITNVLGTLEGSPTTLRVNSPAVGFSAQPPALATGTLGGNASISVTSLSFASNTPIIYKWERLPAGANPATDWVALVNSTTEAPNRYTGVTTRTLTISLAGADDTARQAALALNDDQYRCVINNVLGSATSTAASLRVLAGQFTLVTQENVALPGLVESEGRSFSAIGLPAGLSLDTDTGRVTGIVTAKPGVHRITVTISETGTAPVTKTYYLEVLALSGNNVGGFEALLSATDQPPLAKLTLDITPTGALTGTLTTTVEKTPLALKGAVVRSTAGVLTLAAPLSVNRPGTPAGRAYLVTDLGIAATGKLSVKLKARESAITEPFEIAAASSLIVNSAETGNPGVHLGTYTNANPAPWAAMGVFNLGLTKPAPLATIPEGTPAPSIPVGSGYARAPIGATGLLKITGKLPDGAPLTAAVATGDDASYRIFARPYSAAPGAFFSADFKLASTSVYNPNTRSNFNRYALAAGSGDEVFWKRPTGIAKPPAYAAGFGPLGLTLNVQPWVFFNGPNLGLKFAADGKSATIGAALTGTILANATPNPRGLPTLLDFNLKNLKLTDETPPDASRLTLTFKQGTGIFTGSLFLADSRKILIEGIFLVPSNVNNTELAGGTVTAEGFALIPGLSGGTPTTERIRLHQPDAVPAP